ncbi:MAG TPA: AAA family ATPase [Actinophytocola sp.]|uniref:ATP-binding protein n=1 Tax=Actinophytocola sp. TaxID=1872138 RepID=UPI002DDD0EDA|nr:AAA family ATPase [Actinophytocola sp.]HEV2782840.1 AAA family ATPase [Actinophytocola sp.]
MGGAGGRGRDHVGRCPQLDRIDDALAAVVAGSFRAVAVRGEPGIGKTMLLAELADRAEGRALVVHAGRATEFEQNVPFGVFIDAFDRLRATNPGDAEPLAALTAAAAGDRPPQLDRYRLFRGVRAVLERQAAERGAVLILDDLHWADPASLQLTEYLLRRPPRAPLLIALAHRSAQPPPGLADALARLDSAAVRLTVEPLTMAEIAELLPDQPARRHRLLHRATGGNPLYLNTLADADEQTLTALVGQPVAAPERVLLDVLSTELRALDPVLRHVAHAAAVVGDAAEPELVGWVAGGPPGSAAEALDGLSRCGMLVADGPRFRFRHPLVRAAAYWDTPPAWRTRAHARAARYLRDRHGSLLMLAHHTERSAQPGDAAAVDTLARAAVASRHAAPAIAARLVERALELLPDRDEFAHRRDELRMLLARTLGLSGELARSRALLHEVIQADGPGRTEAVTFSAVVHRLLGTLDEARALLTGELDRLPGTGAATAQALVELAGVEILRHDLGAARRHAARAVEVAAGTGNPAVRAAAHAVLALGSLQANEIAAARGHADRAAWLLDATPDTLLLTELAIVAPLAWVDLHLQHHDRAARHLHRAIELATGSGLTHSMPYLLIADACLHARRGRAAEALTAADDAREYARIMHAAEAAAMADVARLRPMLWCHGPKAALALADRVSGAGRPGLGWWSALARVGLAEVYLAAGRAEACLAQVSDGDVDPATAAYRSALAAVAAAELGRVADGHRHASDAINHAVRAGLTHQLGVAHEARARVLASAGDGTAATADAQAAVTHFAEAGTPVEEGRARHLLATLYARTGRHERARGELGQAKAIFAAGSATWLSAALARDALRLAARGPRSGRATLTSRERQIVDLVTAGLSNREIAERLYLSKKTVETHLSRAYAKLDVRSRVDLTRRIAR